MTFKYKKKRVKPSAIIVGAVLSAFIGLAFGIAAGLIFWHAALGGVVGACMFGFSLDVVFNGSRCE